MIFFTKSFLKTLKVRKLGVFSQTSLTPKQIIILASPGEVETSSKQIALNNVLLLTFTF